MTDRVKGLYVSLDRDMRDDDVEAVMDAIRMVRCVSAVECDQFVTDPSDWMDRDRVRHEVEGVTTIVLRALLTGQVGYCYKPEKTIAALEKILGQLKEKK